MTVPFRILRGGTRALDSPPEPCGGHIERPKASWNSSCQSDVTWLGGEIAHLILYVCTGVPMD